MRSACLPARGRDQMTSPLQLEVSGSARSPTRAMPASQGQEASVPANSAASSTFTSPSAETGSSSCAGPATSPPAASSAFHRGTLERGKSILEVAAREASGLTRSGRGLAIIDDLTGGTWDCQPTSARPASTPGQGSACVKCPPVSSWPHPAVTHLREERHHGMHELIVSPFLDSHLVLRPGQRNAIKISRGKYAQLQSAGPAGPCPDWLARERTLTAMRDAGVLWLQLTGGEPMIDSLFAATYERAFDLGMMIEVLTNGSRLSSPAILGLLTSRPPHRVTLSVYGATEASYDGLTRRRGSYKSFIKGLTAAREAGIPLDLSVVITTDNAHEVDAMHAMAGRLGIGYRDYRNMSPTIYGGGESLPSQSLPHLTRPEPFTGCDAGHTSFHVDPHGRASICKVGREPSIALAEEGPEGLHRLGGIADQLLRRQGGCTGCTLSAMCGSCMRLAAKYRQAKAPLNRYCQHTERHPRSLNVKLRRQIEGFFPAGARRLPRRRGCASCGIGGGGRRAGWGVCAGLRGAGCRGRFGCRRGRGRRARRSGRRRPGP